MSHLAWEAVVGAGAPAETGEAAQCCRQCQGNLRHWPVIEESSAAGLWQSDTSEGAIPDVVCYSPSKAVSMANGTPVNDAPGAQAICSSHDITNSIVSCARPLKLWSIQHIFSHG